MQRTSTAKWMDNQKRWQINVMKNGIRRSFTSSTPGRTGQREANAKADAWLDDNIADTNTRVDTLFREYIDDLKSRTSMSNWRPEEGRGKAWILPSIGRLKISQVNEQHLQEIINKAYSKGRSKKTIKNIRATETAFIKFCRKKKCTTLYPENIVIPKGATVKEKVILQPSDIITLFTTDTTIFRGKRVYDKYINAYRFQLLTGLRPGELIGLKRCDIKTNTVYLSRAINVYGEVTSGKNDNARRAFALSASALQVLNEQIDKFNGEYIFDILNEVHYRRCWKRYCEANGIRATTPYEIRHTFVSVAKALPEGQVKEVVGHSRNMDTFGTYGHAIEGEREKTAQDIERLFDDILK